MRKETRRPGDGGLCGKVLFDFALRQVETCLSDGQIDLALQWLEQVPRSARPPQLEGLIHYRSGKAMAAKQDWGGCEDHFRRAVQADPQPLYQSRLALVRRRAAPMVDPQWSDLYARVDPAQRLRPSDFCPEVAGVWACGAYHSRGAGRGMPWSRFLRLAKEPPEDAEERDAALRLAGDYLCRFLSERTPLLAHVDVVVSIPANPSRFYRRGMSLPDELAHATEVQLGLPFVFGALVSTADAETELKRLSWHERLQAIRQTLSVGDIGAAHGANVLLVDDVVTSGATLRQAASLLREAGAGQVYALTLCHTEG